MPARAGLHEEAEGFNSWNTTDVCQMSPLKLHKQSTSAVGAG